MQQIKEIEENAKNEPWFVLDLVSKRHFNVILLGTT